MIYQTTRLSKIAVILMMVALSSAETCGSYTFNHSGLICEITDTNPDTVSNVCAAHPTDLTTLEYCTVNECTDCETVSTCHSLYPTESYKTLTHTMTSTGAIYVDPVVVCKVTDEEYCYRSGSSLSEDADFISTYQESGTSDNSTPLCCKVECDEKFTFKGQACGFSEGSFTTLYNNESTFCDDYCNNRLLTLTNCGDPGCGASQGCTNDMDTCVSSFNASAPVCGNDYLLYSTVEAYCTAKVANTVSTYNTSICVDGCTQSDCDTMKCLAQELSGYSGVAVCGANGVFYYSTLTYCNARNETGSTLTGFILCNGEGCKTKSECCEEHCVENNPNFEASCASDYNYYSTVAAYCAAYCASVTPINMIKNGANNYTEAQCSSLRCTITEFLFDSCSKVDYNMFTNESYCDDKYVNLVAVVADANIEKCYNNQNQQIDCTQTECDFFGCKNENAAITSSLCGKNSSHDYFFYLNTDAFCTAQGNDPSLASFTCTTPSCSNDNECCFKDCLDLNSSYTTTCNTNFDLYTTVEAYCGAICADVAIAQNGTAVKVNYTQEECLYAKCAADYKVKCDSDTYALVSTNDYCTLISQGNTYSGTLETCGASDCTDCRIFKCQDQTASLANFGVCLKNAAFEAIYFENPAAYCAAGVASVAAVNSDVTVLGDYSLDNNILCNDAACTTDQCSFLNCKYINSAYKNSCDTDTFELLDLDAYCADKILATPVHVNLDNCGTGCTARDCKVLDCLDKITLEPGQTYICLSGASFDNYFFANESAYCSYLVDNNLTYTLGSEVDCTGKQCSTDSDCCTTRCLAETYYDSCQKDTYDFINHSDFCSHRCTNKADFELLSCHDPLDATAPANCTPTSCLNSKCLNTISSAEEKKYCLSTADFKGEYFSSKADFCDTRSSADSSDFSLASTVACDANTCDGVLCCEAVCQTRTDYKDSCDPADYSVINLSSYCSKWCANFTYSPLGCEGSDCEVLDCETKKCIDALDTTLTGNVCLDVAVSDEYFFSNVTNYCSAIAEANKTYTAPTTVACDSGAICASKRDCYIAKCVKDNDYFTKCDPVTFSTLTEAEACGYKFDNGGNDSDLDVCHDNSNNVVACDNCRYFKCVADNTAYSNDHTTLCLDNAVEGEQFFATISAYCKVASLTDSANYTLDSNAYIICNSTDCDQTNCCKQNCLQNAVAGCQVNTYAYKSASDYCDDYCAGNVYNIISGSTSQTECDKLNCLSDLSSITGSICLSTGIGANNDIHYFANLDNYCDEVKSSTTSTYTLADYDCGAASCADSTACCERNCNALNYTNQCDAKGAGVITETAYCADHCSTNALLLKNCFDTDDSTVIPCTDCAQVECEYQTEEIYKDKTYDGVCGTNDTLYPTVRSYCKAHVANTADIQMCTDAQGQDVVCATDADCCKANCLSDKSANFVPVCQDTTYDYIDTVAKYCNLYCPGRSFSAYSTSVPADQLQRECAIQKCIALDTPYIDVCTTDTYILVTETLDCASKYDNSPYTTRDCGLASCTQADCDLQKCEFESLASYNFTKVCANNNTLYNSKSLYCAAKAANSSLDTKTCGASECTAKTCCEANCVATINLSTPFCSDNYTEYADAAAYCAASCDDDGVETLTPLTCDTGICTATECCNKECNLTAKNVCNPTLPIGATVPVLSSSYCADKCDFGTVYTDNIKTCADNCLEDDCKQFKCEYDVMNEYGLGKVCGSNRTLYDNATTYCAAKLASANPADLTYTKCAGDSICSAANECCQKACNDSFASGYDARCTSDYVWAATASDYCANVCGNSALTDSLCKDSAISPDRLCTQDECKEKECLAGSEYVPICDADFIFLNKEDYCKAKYIDKESVFKLCDGDCVDQNSCEKAECLDSLSSYNTKNVCLVAEVNNEFFYSLSDYCQYQASNGQDYTETNFIKCNGDFCAAKEDCCNARCNSKTGYVATCHPTSYTVLTHEQDCAYNCNKANTVPVDTCGSGGNAAACTDCEIFKCQDDTSAITGTICLKAALNNLYFYSDATAYCNAMISANKTNYALANNDLTCTDASCDTEPECCVSSCINDASVNDACKLSDYSVTAKANYCDAICNNQKSDYHDCGADNCVLNDCETLKCNAQNENYKNKAICYKEVSADNPNNVTFYSNLDSYCADKITTPPNSYVISNEVLCEIDAAGTTGPCASENSCCKSLCLSDNISSYTDSCDATYNIINLDAYCTNFCDNNGSYSVRSCSNGSGKVACTSCELFNCLDDLLAVDNDPRKFCIAGGVKDYQYFANVTDLCNYLVVTPTDPYSVTDNNLCGTTDGCTSDNDCCEARCNAKTFAGACAVSDLSYLSQAAYCTNFCSASPVAVETCGADGCSENDCKVKLCEKAFDTYPADQSVCLKTEYQSKNLYATVNELCVSKVANDSIAYQVADVIKCAGDTYCADENHCDEAICLLNEKFDTCDPITFNLVTVASACQRIHINGETTVFDKCYNQGANPDQISCTSCTYFECLSNNAAYLNEPVVCASDDSSYLTLVDFCKAHETTSSLTVFSCTDGSCDNDTECCKDFCLSQLSGNYQSQCNNSNFVYHTTAADYCDSYCANDRSYTKYSNNQEDCCTQKCIMDGTKDTSCQLDTYESKNINESCADLCSNNPHTYADCGTSPCDQPACDKLKCLDVELKNYTFTTVCGNNSNLYSTKSEYCVAKAANSALSFLTCENNECANASKCCEANCLSLYFGSYTGKVCDSNFGMYDNPAAFCAASCNNSPTQTLQLHLCNDGGNQVACNESECCLDGCNNNPSYNGKCDSNYTLLDKSSYCDLHCSTPASVKDCDGDICANQAACDKANCMNALSAYATKGVCLDIALTENYYFTLDNYCNQQVAGTKDYSTTGFATCGADSSICDGQIACCEDNCEAHETYTIGCSSTFELVNKANFCADTKCSATPATISYCQNAGVNIDCVNCDYHKCLHENQAYTSSICLAAKLDGKYSFASVEDYCATKVTLSPDQNTYAIIAAEVKCDSTTCNTEAVCCSTSCNDDTSVVDKCNSSYGLYDRATQCTDFCAGNAPTSYECVGGCDQDACDVMNCEKVNENITTSICTIDIVNSANFFETVHDFCVAKVADSSTSYAVANQVTCDNCSESLCCAKICEQVNFAVCDDSTDLVLDMSLYCTDACLVAPTYTVNKCYNPSDPTEQIDCSSCDIFKCRKAYLTAVGSLTNPVCLTDKVYEDFYFANADEYCAHMITNSASSYAITNKFTCTDGSCDSETECCKDRCTSVTKDACESNFDFISKSSICDATCAGNPINNLVTCGSNDCTAASCKQKECEAAWGDHTGAVCLEKAYFDINFYQSVSDYCNAYSIETNDNFLTSNPDYCANGACDLESGCCLERCLNKNSFVLCHPYTYETITREDFCNLNCSSAIEPKCYDGTNTQIDCTATRCHIFNCMNVFSDANYFETNVCLKTAVNNKFLYTVYNYCQEVSTDLFKVTTMPEIQKCKDASGADIACANEDDCCYNVCIANNPYDGCNVDGVVKTAEAICVDKCSDSPAFTITYCPNADCTSCGNLGCLNENSSLGGKSVCIKSIDEPDYFYSTLDDFCTAKNAAGLTDYAVGETINCGSTTCADEASCCEVRCKNDVHKLTCDKTTHSLVTEDIRCNAFCPDQTIIEYNSCLDITNDAIDCTQDLCNIQHACPAFFTNQSYTGSICIDNNQVHQYYDNVDDYCVANGVVVPTQLPLTISCKNASNEDIKCPGDNDCCIAVCLEHQLNSGCDATFNLIDPTAYCTAKCSAAGAPALDYCGGNGCSDCKLYECRTKTNAYTAGTVCLADGIGASPTIFFSSKDDYCNAMIDAALTDYELDASEYVTCGGSDCTANNCCSYSCNAKTYLDTCNTSDYTVVDETAYCDDLCGSKTLQTVGCKNDANADIACDADHCCAEKIKAEHENNDICGSNNVVYDTALDFCTAQATLGISAFYCTGGCTDAQCAENYCKTTNNITSNTFPTCGSDNEYYSTKDAFCAAYSADISLTTVSGCEGASCEAVTCCNNGCGAGLKPVIYLISGSPVGYANACLGACANPSSTVAYTCDDNMTVDNCVTEYNVTCAGTCKNYISSTNPYCVVDVGYMNAATYCAKYICGTGSNANDSEVLVDCTKYDCTSDGCDFSICLTKSSCPETVDPVCGIDGNVYKNSCYASCGQTTPRYNCPANGDCAAQCIFDKCSADFANDPIVRVCASDGIVYDKANVATCVSDSNTVSFQCSNDCNGDVRELRCKFDCQFNNN